MYQLIATVRTFNGRIDRVVAENASLAMIEETRQLWDVHPGTLLTRIELADITKWPYSPCNCAEETR